MLENSLADFFIKPSDAPFCRNLKLEIMTYLVNAENINRILKEFKVDFFLESFNICSNLRITTTDSAVTAAMNTKSTKQSH